MRVRARFLTAAAAASLVLSGVAAVATPAVTAAAGCSVTNGAKHATTLAAAVKAAAPGATLTVHGTCAGATTIAKRLTIVGGSPAGVLKGKGGRVLTIAAGPVKLSGLTITGGTAKDCPGVANAVCAGGILVEQQGAVTLTRVQLVDNQAQAIAGRPLATGGGMVVRGRATFIESTITGNSVSATTDGEGGAIHVDHGSVTFTRSLLASNLAQGTSSAVGGAIYSVGGRTALFDSTLSTNHASSPGSSVGGGYVDVVNVAWPALRLAGSTVTLNDGGGLAGGLYSSGDIRIDGSIVADNVATSDRDCAFNGAHSFVASYDLVGTNAGCTQFLNLQNGSWVGTNASYLHANLSGLANHGGPTKTHALLDGSAAIGTAGDAPCITARDQRGVKRPKGAACDMGAYERS
ncbi:MAG: choice-of-anchor Q domain-containing protein [Chloroflexota bacterium]